MKKVNTYENEKQLVTNVAGQHYKKGGIIELYMHHRLISYLMQ